MRYHEAKDLVEKLTYKPGWTITPRDSHDFTWEMDGTRGYRVPAILHIDLQHRAPDSTAPSMMPIRIVSGYAYDTASLRDMPKDFFLGDIRRQLHTLECHEVDEWLKLDGKHVVDPHPNERDHERSNHPDQDHRQRHPLRG